MKIERAEIVKKEGGESPSQIDIPQSYLSEEELQLIDSKKTEQEILDQGQLEETRREIAAAYGGEQKNFEDFKNLSNVKQAEKKLKSLLDDENLISEIGSRARTIIYEMLTRRSEFVKSTNGEGKDVAELMQQFQPQKEWYRNTRDVIESHIDSDKDLEWNSNPGWFGVNTRPEEPKRESVNLKVYTTIPVKEYSFIKHVPKLANHLRQLALDSDDIIQVKFPESLSGFMANNDSLVVHFKKKENVTKILELINSWMQSNGVTEAPREMERTRVAADSKESSFTGMVAKNIADWLDQNAGKYDSGVLVNDAIKHAIQQSQKKPF